MSANVSTDFSFSEKKISGYFNLFHYKYNIIKKYHQQLFFQRDTKHQSRRNFSFKFEFIEM